MKRLSSQTFSLIGFLSSIMLLSFIPMVAEASLWDGIACAEAGKLYTCNFCHVVDLANAIVKWLVMILAVIFGIIALIAGFKLVTSAGNPGGLNEGKQMLANALIGLIIVLGAWITINYLMLELTGGTVTIGSITKPWTDIECGETASLSGYEDDFNEGGIAGAPSLDSLAGVTPGSVGEGATVTGNLVTYEGRKFDSGVVGKIEALHGAVPGLTLSGGHRTPERNVEVDGSPTSYHLTGRAADFVGSSADMQAGKQWAEANGAREVLIHNAGSGTHLHVAW